MPTFKERLAAIEKKIANGEPIKEDLIKEIKIIKEDFKKAGIKIEITNEMIDEMTSEKNIQTYIKSQKIASIIAMSEGLNDRIEAKEKEASKKGIDLKVNVSGPLQRCIGYLFNPGNMDDPDVLKENQKIAAVMNSPKGINAIFRKFYNEMLETDENLLYLDSYDDMLEYMSTDTRWKGMYWELINAFNAAKDKGYLEFTPYEEKLLKQLAPTFQSVSFYTQEINTRSNILNFIIPKIDGDDYSKLMRYYGTPNDPEGPEIPKEPEKQAFCGKAMILAVDKISGTEYSKYAIAIFRERGLIGNGYKLIDCYDEKGNVVDRGMSTIANELSCGDRQSVRFVIHSHDEKGAPLDKEVIVTRDDMVQRYNAEQIQKTNPELDATLDALAKFSVTDSIKFDSDPAKAAAQKACLIYQARRKDKLASASRDEWLSFCNSALKNMNEGRDEAYNFIQTKSLAAALAMIKDISSDDKSRNTKAYEKYKSIRNTIQKEASVNAPGQSVLDGMLAPKPDTSKLIPPEKLTSATQEQKAQIKEAYDKISDPDSVLPIPEGWTEHDVSMLTLCTLLQERYMAKAGEHARNKVGSNQPDGLDFAQSGMTNFFENMLKNDARYNVQTASIQAPEVRKEVKRILATYSTGMAQRAVTFPLKSGFNKLKESLRGFSSMDSNGAYSASKYLIDVYELLKRPEFADFVEFSKDDLEAVNLAKAERKLLTEMLSYEKEIQQICDENIYGKPNNNPRKDKQFNDLLKNYFARKLYFAKVYDAKTDLNKELEYNPNKAEINRNQQNKRLSIIESNLISDPEGYIESLKKQITPKNIPAFDKFTSATRWFNVDDGALINVKMNSKASAEYIFTEKTTTKNTIAKEYISKIPETKATKKLRSLLNDLPCMKDELPNDFKDPEARADEYERVAALLEDLNINYEEISEGTSNIKYKNSQKIANELKLIASKLRDSNTLYETERKFQRETIQKEMDSHKELTDDEINARIEDQNKRLDQAENKYGKSFCGRVPFKVLTEIANDRLNSYLKFYQNDTKMKSLLSNVKKFRELKGFENDPIVDLEKYQEELNEKMLDDDSVEIVDKYTAITNIIYDCYAIKEAPRESNEAFNNPNLYEKPYELAQKQYDEVSKILSEIDKNSEPELYKLGDNARIGLKNIREAISNEAYGNKEEGIEALKKDSSLAAVTAFALVIKSEPGSQLRAKLEEVGADKVIKDANKSEPVKSHKKDLDIRSIGKALSERNGFREFIKKSPDEAVKSNEIAPASEIEKTKPEDPNLKDPALGGSNGGPSIGGN